jgi:hypothetical protein
MGEGVPLEDSAMSSALRNFDADSSSPTPVLELPITAPYTGAGNRRFVPRAQAGFTVDVEGETSTGIDISFGGCMCIAAPVWPGNTVDIVVKLEGEDEDISTHATVVELVSQAGVIAMRLRFDGLSNARRKQIALWMARRAPSAR